MQLTLLRYFGIQRQAVTTKTKQKTTNNFFLLGIMLREFEFWLANLALFLHSVFLCNFFFTYEIQGLFEENIAS